MFFFSLYGAHQDLHSFPTRRSSDLLVDKVHDPPGIPNGPRFTIRFGTYTRAVPLPAGRSWRSEEHTSELQSHSELVRRLLLEKKKETTPYDAIRKPPAASS